jgi:hypothetical protein
MKQIVFLSVVFVAMSIQFVRSSGWLRAERGVISRSFQLRQAMVYGADTDYERALRKRPNDVITQP